jgi:FkbM family methyltransferase
MAIQAAAMRYLLRSHVRGSWRLMNFLTQTLPALQAHPLRFEGWPPVYVDLRQPRAHHWLTDPENEHCPWEPEVQTVIRRVVRPGDTVVDVGANEGLHTVLLSTLVGPEGTVYSIEPNPELLACLELTIRGLSNSHLHGIACGREKTVMELFVPMDHARASLTDWTTVFGEGGAANRYTVPVERLETVVAKQPSFMKVDVEGAELDVFQGATDILNRKDAPIVLFEELAVAAHAFGYESSSAADLLESLSEPGYRFFKVEEDGTLATIGTERPDWFNILAVPASRMDRIG